FVASVWDQSAWSRYVAALSAVTRPPLNATAAPKRGHRQSMNAHRGLLKSVRLKLRPRPSHVSDDVVGLFSNPSQNFGSQKPPKLAWTCREGLYVDTANRALLEFKRIARAG